MELRIEMLELFLNQFRQGLQELERVYTLQDQPQLVKVSHAMKSSCSSIGIVMLWQSLREITMAARASDWKQLTLLVPLFRVEAHSSLQTVQDYLDSFKA